MMTAYLVRIVKDSKLVMQLEECAICKVAAHQRVSQKPGKTLKTFRACQRSITSSDPMASSSMARVLSEAEDWSLWLEENRSIMYSKHGHLMGKDTVNVAVA